uniref:Cannabinoid receptor interacting protein 1b n=1 Tax=Poecilia formosa TaxID=48698 RepID=A0A096MIM9_POEFO
MADVPQIVKIGISLKMLPNNSAVFFKSDGARFGQTRTIKLLTGSKYKIEVVVKPGAVQATSMSVGGVTFPLEQQSKDPQSVVYTGQYDTEGVAHTKSGERQPVQINIQPKQTHTLAILCKRLHKLPWKLHAVLRKVLSCLL